MYPVGSCLHVLSDASVRVCRRFLVGPVSECLEAFVFLSVAKHAGFRGEFCGIGSMFCKTWTLSRLFRKTLLPARAGCLLAPRNPVVGSSRRFCLDIFTRTERRKDMKTQCSHCQEILDADGRENGQRIKCPARGKDFEHRVKN